MSRIALRKGLVPQVPLRSVEFGDALACGPAPKTEE